MILVLHCIIFSFSVTTQVPSISPKILFSTHAPSILRLDIILLEIMHLKVTYALNMLILSTNLLIFSPNPWMKINFARLEENLAWLMLMMFKHSYLLNLSVWYVRMMSEIVCLLNTFWHFLVHSCISGLSDSNPFLSDSNPYFQKGFQ